MLGLSMIRDALTLISNYTPMPAFIKTIAWKKNGGADIMVDKKTTIAKTAIIVGTIVDDRLFCGPVGNHMPSGPYPKALKLAKYSFFLGMPSEDAFRSDYEAAVKNIRYAQNLIAGSEVQRYFLDGPAPNTTMKFSGPVFEARVCGSRFSVVTADKAHYVL